MRGDGLGPLTAMTAGFLVTVFAHAGPIRPDPWYAPHFAVPLFGMILGNAMTGISLGVSTLTTTVRRETASIEARLMLGETFWYAVWPWLARCCAAASCRSSTRWRRPATRQPLPQSNAQSRAPEGSLGAFDQVIVADPGGGHARKLPAGDHLRIHRDLGEHREQGNVVVLLEQIIENLSGNPVPFLRIG